MKKRLMFGEIGRYRSKREIRTLKRLKMTREHILRKSFSLQFFHDRVAGFGSVAPE